MFQEGRDLNARNRFQEIVARSAPASFSASAAYRCEQESDPVLSESQLRHDEGHPVLHQPGDVVDAAGAHRSLEPGAGDRRLEPAPRALIAAFSCGRSSSSAALGLREGLDQRRTPRPRRNVAIAASSASRPSPERPCRAVENPDVTDSVAHRLPL